MNDNINKFLELYNVLDDELRKYFNDESRTYSAISRYVTKLNNSPLEVNRNKGETLDMIRVLRNNLVHELDMNSKKLISINNETVEFLQKEIDKFLNPLKVKDICTKIDDVVFASLDDTVSNLTSLMYTKGYTQLPILNEDGSIFGVFSPNCIYGYLAKNGGEINKKLLLKQLIQFLPLENHVSEYYLYVSENVSANDILEKFDQYYNSGKRLQMAFVTEGGKRNGKLIGIIVIQDLLKIRI